MYNGYLIKINGMAYPVRHMVLSSYSVKDEPMIIDDYYDTAYNRHVVKAPKNKIEITFTIRQLYDTEYPEAIAPFTDTMEIEYYNPMTGLYTTDIFTYDGSLQPQLDRIYNTRVLYKEVGIKLIRKAGGE